MADITIPIFISACTFSVFLITTVFSFNVRKLAKGSRRLMWFVLPVAFIMTTLSTLLGTLATAEYLNLLVSDLIKQITSLIGGLMLIYFFKELLEAF